MRKKIYNVVDLGGGDGGKGSTIQALCYSRKAFVVLKKGGKGGHSAYDDDGRDYSFSHFGCGTFEGIPTHITSLMMIEPFRFITEAETLKYDFGVVNAFELITIDREVQCTTPFHMIKSRLTELARKDNPKGVTGLGFGTTIVDGENFHEDIIRAKELGSKRIKIKLERIKERIKNDLKPITENIEDLWSNDQKDARELVRLLNDPGLVDRIVRKFNKFAGLVKITDEKYFENLLSQNGVMIVEATHGVLNDRYYGFHPHVSRVRTSPHNIIQELNNFGYDGQIINLGLCRSYGVRHGHGVFPTEDENLLEEVFFSHFFNTNRWQGKVRVGALDTVMLRYAIEACGGSDFFDGLVVSCADQIEDLGEWPVCNSYSGMKKSEFFESGSIIVSHKEGEKQSRRQMRLGEFLKKCSPNIKSYNFKDRNDLIRLITTKLEKLSGVPVRMISFGPKKNDKLYI